MSKDTAQPPANYVVREVFLKRPTRSRNAFLRQQLDTFKMHLSTLPLLVILLGLTWLLEPVTQYPMEISLAITSTLGIGLAWWAWSWRPRLRSERRQATLLAAAKERLHGIGFDDGSIRDFSSDGFVRTRSGNFIVFDTRHRLIRNLSGRHGGEDIEMDWLFGMAPWMTFSVEDLPRRGLGNRLRRGLGLKPRLETVLALRSPEPMARFPLAPGFEAEARRLAAKANRVLADDRSGALT